MTDEQQSDDQHDRQDEAKQPSPELTSLTEQLEAARAERDENYNLFLRTQAELENYRKRINREREEEVRYRVLPLARDLLPVKDNLHRAIEAASTTGNTEDLIRGIEMVIKQFEDVLENHAVKPIPAEGETFDPNKHDAMAQVPSADHEPMTILQEVERGYMLHDRVVRPSKVIVATPPANE